MSNDDTNRSDELKAVEQSLRSLEPSETGVNRDRLMYQAGWGACESAMNRATPAPTVAARADGNARQARTWLWPATSAALLLVSATLATVLVTREPEKEIVYAYASQQATENATAVRQPAPIESRPNAVVAPAPSESSWLDMLQSFANISTRPSDNYFTLRSRVLTFGVDVLPSAGATHSATKSPLSSPSYAEMRGALLGG
jgi:hypothetical protein